MRQPRDQHWADLLEEWEGEVAELGGYGELTVRIQFHDSQPREYWIEQRRRRRLLGKGAVKVAK